MDHSCRIFSVRTATRRCARSKLFHAGLDDHEAWTDFDGDTESLHPTTLGKETGSATRADSDAERRVAPVTGMDTSQAAHSDQILVLDGDGEGAGDYMVADRAIKMLQQVAADPDKPFFVGCGFSKPHSPPQAPQRFFDMYDPEKIKLPPDFAPWPTVPAGWPKAAIRPRNADLRSSGAGRRSPKRNKVIRALSCVHLLG